MTRYFGGCAAMRRLGVSRPLHSLLPPRRRPSTRSRSAGRILCGVNTGLLGFSAAGEDGKWTGFDVDFCSAVAAAIFGDAEKVDYMPLRPADRFEALKTVEDRPPVAELDLDDGTRDRASGSHWSGVTYYDGQGFMVPRAANAIRRRSNWAAARSASRPAPPRADNLADYFTANNMAYEAVVAASPDESIAAYKDGLQCGHQRHVAALLRAAQARRSRTSTSSFLTRSRRSLSDQRSAPTTRNGQCW